VDLESYWLRCAAGGRPVGVVRVIVDTPGRELTNPLSTLTGGAKAHRVLRRSASSLAGWRPAPKSSYPQ
jgi:hypothetical protein